MKELPTSVSDICIADFDYPLPDERIAMFPAEQRDQSKLLVYNGTTIAETRFADIVNHLPKDAYLVFNDTKVVQARLLFRKETGASIEIFCLEPVYPTREIQQAFNLRGMSRWKCFVGNRKKWKENLRLRFEHEGKSCWLEAEQLELVGDAVIVEFRWNPENLTFAEVLEINGKVPLPPYIHRTAEQSDKQRYQTIYAHYDGSVAAPTAGLHFTDKVFAAMEAANISHDYVTLHVGAGTFKPVNAVHIGDHQMHAEQIIVSREVIARLQENLAKNITAVGTTSVRTLESLYWLGMQLHYHPQNEEHLLHVSQWEPYQYEESELLSSFEALDVLLRYLEKHSLTHVVASTQIMIVPTYSTKVVKNLITNFHQPKSTLLLLISAFVGNQWRSIYDYALQHDFRFLSYGDSCLFLR